MISFRSSLRLALAQPGTEGRSLSGQVLGLCADAGLVEVGVLAVDGTKLEASASNHASKSYERIASEILAEAGARVAERRS